MTPTQAGTLTAVAVAAAAGPATLWLVRATQHRVRLWRPSLQAVFVVGVGLLAASVATIERGYGLLVLVVLGGAAAAVDLVEQRLPNLLTAGLALGAVATVTADVLLTKELNRAAEAAATAAAVLAALIAVKLAHSPMIGWGDVKFTAGLAGLLGWWSPTAVFTAVIAWAVLIAATAAILAMNPQSRGAEVPYGPALWLGALAAFFAAG